MSGRPRALVLLALAWLAGLALSFAVAVDRATWLMETAPAMVALPLLWATAPRFRFTALAYALIDARGLILMLGGAYTYARVPAGFWLQDALGLARNPYDRIGHFAQGFVPAILARELLIRVFAVGPRALVAFLAAAIALAISAGYELLEWGVAVALGAGADAFLGTQGDLWDTQADMFCALVGALAALALLGRVHDRAIARLPAR